MKQAEPLAFYLGGDGRVQAVKQSGFLSTNSIGRTGLGYAVANAEQYARAAIASVWANNCINLRADTMARFEWFVRNKRTKDKVEEHPFTEALYRSKQNIMRLMEKRILTYGEFFLKPLHNSYNRPTAFFALNNLDMDIDDSLGYIKEFRYTPQGARQQAIYYPRGIGNYLQQIVYIHNDNDFDDHRGLSRFESILLEIGIDVDISRTTANFYKNDARPGLLLIPEFDLTKEQAEEFMDYWNAQFKGSQNTGRTALAPRVIKEIREFQRPPSIDDVELRESTRREICAAFKVPLSMAGAWDDATYQSLPEQRKFFYEETMIPAADANAEDLTKNALPFFDDTGENEVAYDASAILALVENAAEKVDINVKKLNSGGYTINEFREANGDEPIEGGDVHILQSGWITVRADELVTYEAPNTAPTQEPMQEIPAPDVPQLPAEVPTRSDPKKKYNPDQPRDNSGRFGSGGGGSSGGGGDDSGGGDKPKPKPKKPKKPTEDKKPKPEDKPKPAAISDKKPEWASTADRNAAMNDGYLDMGHIEDNPINGTGNMAEKEIASAHARNLSPKHQSATKEYTGDAYRDINNGLRSGTVPEDYADTVANIDDAMSRNSLPRNTVLYRGMKLNDGLRERLVPGATFSDAAYTSTSFDQTNANRFSGATGSAVMRIKAPAGTNGIAVSDFSDYPEEREFLLPRNTSYRITGVARDSAGKLYIDAEIIGADGQSKSIRFYISTGNKADNPPPSEDDRSDKFNWSEGDIVFDEPVETEDDNEADGSESDNDKAVKHYHDHSPVTFVPIETTEVKTIHADALRELKAWQKFHANGTATKRAFTAYMIRDDIADTIAANLATVGNDNEAIKAVFKAAEETIAIKQADVVRSNFELEMKTLIDIGRSNSIKRIDFTNRLKSSLYKYGVEGMIAGLADGGVIIENKADFSEEDAATFETLYAEQSRHAVSLSEQVYSGKLTDAQALLKPRQWFGGSIQPFYDAGLLSAARNGMVEFVGTIDGASCATCKALVGQRHRRRMFAAYGFNPPYGSGIICSDGNLCKHRLISVNSRARGSLSRAPRK